MVCKYYMVLVVDVEMGEEAWVGCGRQLYIASYDHQVSWRQDQHQNGLPSKGHTVINRYTQFTERKPSLHSQGTDSEVVFQ